MKRIYLAVLASLLLTLTWSVPAFAADYDKQFMHPFGSGGAISQGPHGPWLGVDYADGTQSRAVYFNIVHNNGTGVWGTVTGRSSRTLCYYNNDNAVTTEWTLTIAFYGSAQYGTAAYYHMGQPEWSVGQNVATGAYLGSTNPSPPAVLYLCSWNSPSEGAGTGDYVWTAPHLHLQATAPSGGSVLYLGGTHGISGPSIEWRSP